MDSAGNTTAAIGKGFAIGSATLVALALYGAYLHSTNFDNPADVVSFNDPLVFACLLFGAMLPYAFSAMTMKSVGKAAFGMVKEVRRQIHENPGILEGLCDPDYKACVKISTIASLKEMILPGLMVNLRSHSGHPHPITARIFLRAKIHSGIPPRRNRKRRPNGRIGFQYGRCLG